MKQLIPINATKDELAPTITSHYHKAGWRDFAPRTSDNEPARHTAILEITMEEPKIIQIGNYTGSGNSQDQYVLGHTPLACALRGRKENEAQEKWESRIEVGGDVANCLTSRQTDSLVMERNVMTPKRTEQAKALRKQGVEKFSNRQLEPRADGISNTITTVVHDNLVYEPAGQVIGSMQANAMRGSIDGVSPCLTEAMGTGGSQIPMVTGPRYRIRKLTTREAFRLMDVDDADIDKIRAAGISKSQQYKMAGNSIVVSCLYHIFRKIFIETENENQQLTLF